MATGKPNETLISFESGHYKKVKGKWLGDSVWTHFAKDSGGQVHINKDKVEYYETFGEPAKQEAYREYRCESCELRILVPLADAPCVGGIADLAACPFCGEAYSQA